MIRTFHNVGQGAFYTEEFNGMTMVYDCGGSNKHIIEASIRNTFERGQKIDKLFISHFHNDHINGLEFLLSYCNVSKVYLPLLHEKSEIQFLIENTIFGGGNSFVADLITDPENTIREASEETGVIRVKPINNDLINDSAENKIRDNFILSGDEIPLNHSIDDCKWVLVPYNFQYDIFNAELCTALENDDIDIHNIAVELRDKQKRIVEIYKSVLRGSNNFNANSLVLYSGAKENQVCDIECFIENNSQYAPYWRFRVLKSGCLYLGDYNVSNQSVMDDLRVQYGRYWDNINTVQIPHHGSKYNFNMDLVDENTLAVISAGEGRRHPHASTLKKIIMKKAIVSVVTEDIDTKIIQRVYT